MNNSNSQKPNIIMLLVDDMGWMDLSCMGSTFYETPNIDSLAKDGMLFKQAYAACPVCSPTRASILTGKYPARVGITDWINTDNPQSPSGPLLGVSYLNHLPSSEYTLANALKDNGYSTWHVGKWHLGEGSDIVKEHGFDKNIGGAHWGCPHEGFFAPWNIPDYDDSDIEEGTYLDDHLTQRVLELLDNHDTENPFFLNMCYYAVHTPIQAPEYLIKKYKEKAKKLSLDEFNPIVEYDKYKTCELKGNTIYKRIIQSDPVYAAMVEALDINVGKLLKKLDELGISDNTLITFTSDNGGLAVAASDPPTCNLPLNLGKGYMYEGGVREPLLVRWPKVIKPSCVCNQYMTSTDYYPTFLEAAGIAPIKDQHVDGMSILPLLKGNTMDRGPIFWHYPHYVNQGGMPYSSVRDGKWKLIKYYENPEDLLLFDLSIDISEMNNVADENQEITQTLERKLDDWCLQEVHGVIPQANPEWDGFDV